MKNISILIFFLLILNEGKTQSINVLRQEVDSAQLYLTGTFKKYNPQKAFALFKQRSDTGEAKAMNAVALMYTKGIGVDSSFSNAIYWYTKAVQKGYKKALVNIGMMYKHHAKDSLGYSQAVHYFKLAVQAQEPSAYFALGYMYYKGLGCIQSYSNALVLFKQGVTNNRPDCIYFIGLCYKYGYGVVSNIDSAETYFNNAAILGYTQANSYFANSTTNQGGTASRSARPQQNNNQFNNNNVQAFEKTETARNEFLKIPKSKIHIQILGSYTGIFTQYDYSGTQILAQLPIGIKLFANGKSRTITGNFTLGNSQPIELQAIQQGNQLIFSQTKIPINISKRKSKEIVLVFKSAILQHFIKGDTAYLQGSIQLFNTYSKETDKPIVINLKGKSTPSHNETTLKNEGLVVGLFPNPTPNKVTIKFKLHKSSAVKINVYDLKGVLVFTNIYNELLKGENILTINPFGNINKGFGGVYNLTIQANGMLQSIPFIKE